MRSERQFSNVRIILTVFAPFTAAYLISELYRNVNAVMAPELKHAFEIGPSELGLLSSVFLVAIAAVQIPVGVMLDRYGSRRIVSLFMGIAVAGAMLFTVPNYYVALTGRFLIGLGLGACWAGAYRANVLWWPRQHQPLVNGCLLGVSGLGALAATRPMEALLQVTSWQTLFYGLAIATLLIAFFIFIAVPSEDGDDEQNKVGRAREVTLLDAAKETASVAGHPLFLRIFPLTFMCEGTWLAYQGLWGGEWLRNISSLAPAHAANVLFTFALAIVIGQIALSATTGWLVKKGAQLEWVMLALTGSFVAVQAVICLFPHLLPIGAWGVLGFLTAGPILSYAWLTTELPHAWAGRIVSLLNLCATLAGFALQYMVGALIDLFTFWSLSPALSQRLAFGLMIGGQGAAIAWLAVSKTGLAPASTDTSETVHNAPKECLCLSEEDTARNSSARRSS